MTTAARSFAVARAGARATVSASRRVAAASNPRAAREHAARVLGIASTKSARERGAPRRASVRARASSDDDDDAQTEAEKQRLAQGEFERLRSLPLADEGAREKLESVQGVEGVPQAIIEAERKSKPLRRYRLASYALASCVAAAQMVAVIQACVEAWPEWQSEAPVKIFMDVVVIMSGSLLWRVELQNRAESLKAIWKKAAFREESLTRAEAGLGDTLWTSRMRKRHKGYT